VGVRVTHVWNLVASCAAVPKYDRCHAASRMNGQRNGLQLRVSEKARARAAIAVGAELTVGWCDVLPPRLTLRCFVASRAASAAGPNVRLRKLTAKACGP
jgi:hypothetical protein